MSRTGLLFILLAFAAGGLIGFMGGAGSGDVILQGSGNGAADDARPPPEPELPPMPNAPSGGYTSLEHALESIPYGSSVDGEGMLSGTVLTEAGKPMKGVLVRATYRADRRQKKAYRQAAGVPEDESLEEMVRTYVARVMKDRKNRRDGTTDDQGRFVIAGIGDGKYWLRAYHEGYSFKAVGQNTYELKAGTEVEFTGKPLGDLKVSITLPDGTAPEKASILLKFGSGSTRTLPWIRADPWIQLSPGTHTLSATAGESQEFGAPDQSVEIVEGVTPPPVQFALRDRPGIHGQVVMPAGENKGAVQVYIMSLKPGETPDEKRLRSEGQSTWIHGRSPKYSFMDLQPGTWAVGLSLDQRTMALIETVEVGRGLATLDLTVPEPNREEYLVVRLEGPGGKLITDVSFSTGYRAGGSSSSGGSRTARMPDGTWHVWHPKVPDSTTETVTYTLSATSQQYGTQNLEYDRTTTSELLLRFEDPGTLEVTIAGYQGSGVEGGVGLIVEPAKGQRNSWYYPQRNNRPDSEGRQSFTTLTPGPYRILVYLKRTGSQYFVAARVPITVKSGKNTETVNLPAFHSLTVLSPVAKEGAHFSISSSGGSGELSFYDNARISAGKAVFERVPAGTYVLSDRSGSIEGRMEVTIPGQTVVRFVPTPRDCLKVSIADAKGRLAMAGLAEGDVVVAIDGMELTGNRQSWALLQAAYVKPQTVLAVLRGRGRLDIALDLRKTSGDPGGSFTPASR